MDQNVLYAGGSGLPGQGDQMVLVAVYSSVRDQPKEMETRAGGLLESLFQDRVTRQLTVLNQRGEVVQEGVQAFLLKRKPKG